MERDIELKSGEILKKYRLHKWISNIIVVLDIAVIIYMIIFKMDYRITYVVGGFASFLLTLGIFALYAVIGIVAVLIKRVGAVKIERALYDQCDPFVYEACLDKLHVIFYKERFACLHAIANYYQGNYGRAEEILRRINQYKLTGIYKLNYYILMSALCFRKGEGQRVAEFERIYLTGTKKKKSEQMYFRMLCASNNLYRAMENKDYKSAFRFLAERKELDGARTKKWTLIGYSMWQAKICAAVGDKESARMNLDYVISEGGRLVDVAEAKELLAKINGVSDGE